MGASRDPFIVADPSTSELFASQLEHRPFRFRHRLSASPLFELGALRQLVQYFHEHGLPSHVESVDPTAKGWGERPAGLSVVDAFDDLARGNVLILLKSAHQHPAYATLLHDVLQQVETLRGDHADAGYERPICTLILASPGRITPYHMDDAHNLLFQIQGSKAFKVFDGHVSTVVTERELEKLWSGDYSAAQYSPEKERQATTHSISAEDGVHVPLAYPHWAENGHDISVALSINYQPRANRRAHVFKINHRLRRLGLTPTAPGHFPALDVAKSWAFQALSSLRPRQAFDSLRAWRSVGALHQRGGAPSHVGVEKRRENAAE